VTEKAAVIQKRHCFGKNQRSEVPKEPRKAGPLGDKMKGRRAGRCLDGPNRGCGVVGKSRKGVAGTHLGRNGGKKGLIGVNPMKGRDMGDVD